MASRSILVTGTPGFIKNSMRPHLSSLAPTSECPMPCNEDDWEVPFRRGEFALKIKTALPWQSHVEDQTGGAIRGSDLRKSEIEAK